MNVTIEVDRSSDKTFKMQAYEQLRNKITSGKLSSGVRLPTLKELERQSGLSIGTLRNAFEMLEHDNLITKRPRAGIIVNDMTPKTSKAVQRQSESGEINNASAKTIAIIGNPGVESAPNFAMVASAFEMEISQSNSKSFFIKLDESMKLDEKAIKKIDEADGIFYMAIPPRENEKLVKQLCYLAKPLVVFDYYGDEKITAVNEDGEWGIREAVMHLKELGHKRIAYLSIRKKNQFSATTDWVRRREKHFAAAVEYSGLTFKPDNLFLTEIEGDPKKGASILIGKFLSSSKNYSAVIAGYDILARELLIEAQKRNIKIPEDLSVIGYDNSRVAFAHGITSIQPSTYEDGKQAAELLFEMFTSNRERALTVTNKPKLVIRESTGINRKH